MQGPSPGNKPPPIPLPSRCGSPRSVPHRQAGTHIVLFPTTSHFFVCRQRSRWETKMNDDDNPPSLRCGRSSHCIMRSRFHNYYQCGEIRRETTRPWFIASIAAVHHRAFAPSRARTTTARGCIAGPPRQQHQHQRGSGEDSIAETNPSS